MRTFLTLCIFSCFLFIAIVFATDTVEEPVEIDDVVDSDPQEPLPPKPKKPPVKPSKYHSWAEQDEDDGPDNFDDDDDPYAPYYGRSKKQPATPEAALKQHMGKPALGIVKLKPEFVKTKRAAEDLAMFWHNQMLSDHLDSMVTSIDKETVIVYTTAGTDKMRVKSFLQGRPEALEVTLD